ncbi:MAG TPA: hypothetical protein VNS19_20710 [Acidimicrobiales bacterium]|nr:hypothetical protein [Acidimicrobiales bacterium]
MDELRASGGVWDGDRCIDELQLGDRFEPAEPWVFEDDSDPEFPYYADDARGRSVGLVDGTVFTINCTGAFRGGVDGRNLIGLTPDEAGAELGVDLTPDPDDPDLMWIAGDTGVELTADALGRVGTVTLVDWNLIPDED